MESNKHNLKNLRLPTHKSFTTDSDVSHDEAYTPSLPVHTRTLRRMRRHLLRVLSRKYLAALALFALIFIGILHSADRLPSSQAPWSWTSTDSCPGIRSNPYNLQPPEPTDPAALAQIWRDLEGLFDTYPPSPKHLDVPLFENDLNFPTKEQMGSFFHLSDEEAASSRTSHREVLAKLPPYPSRQFRGRGIVMLAGGRFSEYAATTLGMIREVGSQLPVEVWMKDDTENVPGWCEELEKEGMVCRRLSDYMDPGVLRHSYVMKVFTLLLSSFEEILYLDADSAPIQNPDPIFDSDIYHENGAILWPDYWGHTGSPWLPYIIGLSETKSDMLTDERSVESGQIVWHKKRHWKSLLLATYYNYYGPDFYYTIFNNGWAGWGDKDTFGMALRATYEPWVQIAHPIITIFLTGTMLGIGMIQASPLNDSVHDPMFLHSNMVKWSMREFSCIGCDDQPGYSSRYHLEDTKSFINTHLKEGKRIFKVEPMREFGIDPEPLMWKSLEHTACRSAVWGHDQPCKQTRQHMEKTFGFKFQRSEYSSIIGTGKDYCLVDSVVADDPTPTPLPGQIIH